MDFDLAVTYVRKHGTTIDQARLQFLLSDEPLDARLREQVFSGQREDGGWASFWATDYSSLDATCYRLARAESLGLLSEPPAVEARKFLQTRQRKDGSWNENPPAGVTPPPWLAPDTPATICYLTANCGFWLYRLGAPREAIVGAADYLSANIDLSNSFAGPLHLLWLSVPILKSVSRTPQAGLAASVLQQRLPRLSASNLAWALTAFLVADTELGSPLCVEILARLRELQNDDGSWPSDDGEPGIVHTTLEAIRLFHTLSQ